MFSYKHLLSLFCKTKALWVTVVSFVLLTDSGFTQIAQAASIGSIRIVDAGTYAPDTNSFIGIDGEFQKLFPEVNPGIYGLEVRSGKTGGRDWEIGIGTQTSHLDTFTQGEFDWHNDTLFDFELMWNQGTASTLMVTIGNSTTSYTADWQASNALKIAAWGNACFNVTGIFDAMGTSEFTSEGASLTGQVGQTGTNCTNVSGVRDFFIAGDALTSGWKLRGQISMPGGNRGGRDVVLVTTGTFIPNSSINSEETHAVPEPTILLGVLGALAMGMGLKHQQKENHRINL